jgi:exonuclease VII large subunit
VYIEEYFMSIKQQLNSGREQLQRDSSSSSSSKEEQEKAAKLLETELVFRFRHMWAKAEPALALLERVLCCAASLAELQRRYALVQRRVKQLQLQVSHACHVCRV